jgi:hypothetical protein
MCCAKVFSCSVLHLATASDCLFLFAELCKLWIKFESVENQLSFGWATDPFCWAFGWGSTHHHHDKSHVQRRKMCVVLIFMLFAEDALTLNYYDYDYYCCWFINLTPSTLAENYHQLEDIINLKSKVYNVDDLPPGANAKFIFRLIIQSSCQSWACAKGLCCLW